jgi:DNA-binding SARP family transcriptional activator
LLKILIASGGQQVPVAHLAECLWPQADGDNAKDNLKTTLARLRKLIGSDAVTVNDNSLTLANDTVWVDALQLEEAYDESLEGRDLDIEIETYCGAFLAADSDAVWSMRTRERLRNKWLRTIERKAHDLVSRDAVEAAIEILAAAIDVDDQTESLYALIVECLIALGRQVDALRFFQRYERSVLAPQNLTLSVRMQALKRSLVEQSSVKNFENLQL